MLVDMRTYTIHPGRMQEFLAAYEKEALPLQMEHLGNLIGYFVTEVGPLNQVIHLWGYQDAADRERRRGNLLADQRFLQLGDRMYHLVQAQENKLLRPTAFSPIR